MDGTTNHRDLDRLKETVDKNLINSTIRSTKPCDWGGNTSGTCTRWGQPNWKCLHMLDEPGRHMSEQHVLVAKKANDILSLIRQGIISRL